MKKIIYVTIAIITVFTLNSCVSGRGSAGESGDIETSKSVIIPKDGSGPIAGTTESANPDRVVHFGSVGEKVNVKTGEVVNFIYDGVDPDRTYVKYESTDEGYTLELAYRNDPVYITFKTICQSYIVSNPSLTNIEVPRELRFEQIIWTPRNDGTWEIRIGTIERGCKSQSLQDLQKLRNKNYELQIPKTRK